MSGRAQHCELCGREVPALTRHHLIPRTRHSKLRNRKGLDRQDLERVALLCRPCHKQIHVVLDEKELARGYDTVEALASHPEIAKFVDWIRGKPGDLRVTSYRSNRRGPARRSGPR